jgi:hypothetical protein
MSLTVIGDVHQKYGGYVVKTEKAEHSLQLGDMGFDYRYLTQYIDPERHKFFGGNHENYDTLLNDPPKHCIGDYGMYTHGGTPFFYIRGGYSIDLHYRILGQSWWAE